MKGTRLSNTRERLNLYLPAELAGQLKELAAGEGRSVNAVCSRILAAHFVKETPITNAIINIPQRDARAIKRILKGLSKSFET